MSEWFDLSVPICEGMRVYAPEEGYSYEQQKVIGPDSACNLSRISMGCHCGTHVDAPAHFLTDEATIEQMGHDAMIGPALVATVDEGGELPDLTGVERLILRVRGDGLTMEQAQRVVDAGVKLLGVNLLSVAAGELTAPVHRLLLNHLVWIVETLDLSNLWDGPCDLICMPLRLVGREAAPARVMARPRRGVGVRAAKPLPVVKLGRWPQDAGSDEARSIEWIVVNKRGNTAMLMSRFALARMAYHAPTKPVTWAESALRQWLNREFLEKAFSNRERDRLQRMRVKAEPNARFDFDPGEDTLDKVWLPSIGEARELVESGFNLFCNPSPLAREEGLYASDAGHCSWWLRTNGRALDHAVPVGCDGSIGEWGCLVSSCLGVRPMIALRID